jgi:cold shock CspA family protein
MIGKIKFWVRDRGYGFITIEGGMSWFAHCSQVVGDTGDLRSGDEVEFLLDDDPHGRDALVAVGVAKVKPE